MARRSKEDRAKALLDLLKKDKSLKKTNDETSESNGKVSKSHDDVTKSVKKRIETTEFLQNIIIKQAKTEQLLIQTAEHYGVELKALKKAIQELSITEKAQVDARISLSKKHSQAIADDIARDKKILNQKKKSEESFSKIHSEAIAENIARDKKASLERIKAQQNFNKLHSDALSDDIARDKKAKQQKLKEQEKFNKLHSKAIADNIEHEKRLSEKAEKAIIADQKSRDKATIAQADQKVALRQAIHTKKLAEETSKLKQEEKSLSDNRKRVIATQKKLIKDRDKNRVKLKLLQEKVHQYGLELKKVAGGSELLRKSLKGDAVAFQQLRRAIESARQSQGKYNSQGILTTRGTRNVHGSISVLRSKLLLASFAMGGMARTTAIFTEASREQEIAVKRVANVIRSQGYIAGVTTREVESLASSLQDTTGVTDELTLESSALLLSFQNIGSDILPMAQKAVLDMTSALNGGKITTETLKTQTIQLAKALDDPVKGMNSLRRAGTTFDKSTQNQIKSLTKQGKILEAQKIILGAVNKQYGDSASIDSYELSQRALSSAIGDLNERIGDHLTPRLKVLNDIFTEFVKSIDYRDIENTAKAMGTLSLVALAFSKNLRKLAYTSVIASGGLSFLLKASAGLLAVLGTKKIFDYVDSLEDVSESTNKVVKSTQEAREVLGKFNKEQLRGQIDQYTQLINSTKKLQKAREKEIEDIAKTTAFADRQGKLNQEGLDWLKDKIKNDKELSRITNYLVQLMKDRTDAQAVLDAKESSSFNIRKSNFEEILKKLREERVVLMQKDELTQKLTKSQIENGLITIDVSDASQNAIEEEIKLIDQLVKKKKAEQEIRNLSFQLASESASALHTIFTSQLADINALEEAELNRIKNTSEYKLAVAQGDEKKISNLEKKSRKASYDARKKKFDADQALAYSNIAISLAQGVMNAYSKYDFFVATTISALLASIAVAQTSAVSSAPAPKPYKYGGLVGGNLHSSGGTIIEAERGEYVMSRNAVKNFGVSNMDAINSGGVSPINITFNNSVMSEDYTEDVIIPQIKKAVQRGADIGVS